MADLSLPITYNSLSINSATFLSGGKPASGYLVDEFDPFSLEVDQYLEKRALRDGYDASDVYHGRRTINMIVTAYGSTRNDFWDKYQALSAAFNPRLAYNSDTANLGFLALDFYQPTADISTWPLSAYPNGIALRYYCRPQSVSGGAIRRVDTGGSTAVGLSRAFRISLLAKDPMKVSQDEYSSSSPPGLTYKGDYPSYADIVIVSGSATGDGSLNVAGNVLSVTLNTASTSYTFRSDGTFYRGSTLRMDLLYENSTPFIFDGTGGSLTAGGVFTGVGAATRSFRWRDVFA